MVTLPNESGQPGELFLSSLRYMGSGFRCAVLTQMIDHTSPIALSPASSPAPKPRPSVLRRIFVGPRGLRAGWKCLIFLLLFGGIAMCFRPIVRAYGTVNGKAGMAPDAGFVREFLIMTALLIATAIMARWIDRRPFGYFGVPIRDALRSNFWVGAVVGLGTLALQLELMHLGGWFDFGALQLHGAAVLKYGALWALMFLCVGVTEESMLRGYLLRVTTDGLSRLPKNWSFWTSAILFSVLFAAAHLPNGGENPFGIFMVFVDGMAMCFSLWRTGNLWFAIGNHAAWDWGETFLFGTPDSGVQGQHVLLSPSFHGPTLLSGGTAGPEGSVLVLISEALIFVVVALIYRRRRYALIGDPASS
jgi:membrane protease YdiL (CAAX protease family)